MYCLCFLWGGVKGCLAEGLGNTTKSVLVFCHISVLIKLSPDAPLEVEEGRVLAFHFNNFTMRDLYVYIFCLEETGELYIVHADSAFDVLTRPSC